MYIIPIILNFSLLSPQQKPDNSEIGIDDEIITIEETDYRERKQPKKGKPAALVTTQSETGIDVLTPSFVMDESNRNQTWLYDTPGIINENQV